MEEVKRVNISDNIFCDVFISDDIVALNLAKKSGRAIIPVAKDGNIDISFSNYIVEDVKAIDDELLRRVASRYLHMPLTIKDTKRIIIREFDYKDFDFLKNTIYSDKDKYFLGEDEEIFLNKESFYNYVHDAYLISFFGIFAIVDRHSQNIIGKIGIIKTQIDDKAELSYHIFPTYRRMGYAKEAIEAIINYSEQYLHIRDFIIRVHKENIASINLAKIFNIDIKIIEL